MKKYVKYIGVYLLGVVIGIACVAMVNYWRQYELKRGLLQAGHTNCQIEYDGIEYGWAVYCENN